MQMTNVNDPLGEIERLAKHLWKESGEKKKTSWRDFIPDAEQQLLSGLSSPRHPAPRPKVEVHLAQSSVPQPRFRGIAALLHIENGLDLHECYCFAKLMTWYRFRTDPGAEFQSCSKDEISELLSILAVEYESGLLIAGADPLSKAVPLEELRRYWTRKLDEWEREDQPLGYSDRNTLERVKDQLIERGLFSEIQVKK